MKRGKKYLFLFFCMLTLPIVFSRSAKVYAALEVDTIVNSDDLYNPCGVAVDSTGNVYIADTMDGMLKKWDKVTGNVSLMAYSVYAGGLAVDSIGNVYLADTDYAEFVMWNKASGGYTTQSLTSDLNYPVGVAVDSADNVYIADAGNARIVKWDKDSQTYTILIPTGSGLYMPSGVAVDSDGNVYIADTYNNAIKRWDKASNSITTLVSSGLNWPNAVALDSAGNVYIADTYNNAIKRWDKASGSVTTLVSSGLNQPNGIAVDNTGNVFIADTYNNVIKRIKASEAPTVNQSGGIVPGGTQITLSCATEGAEIYYTEDGSTPTTSSSHYTEPITISSTKTIKAIAVKSGMLDSNVMSESYTAMYTINVQSTDSALGNVEGGGTYAAGTCAALTAKPRMGSRFVKWTSDAEGNNEVSTEKTLSITVNNSSAYYAWFTPDTYTLTVGYYDSSVGIVSGVKAEGYTYNEEAVLTAAANAGYSFDGWKNEYGVTAATGSSITLKVSGNMTITPVFTQIVENTTYYTAAFYHQSGNLLKSEKVAAGSTITPPNAPTKAGYDFIGWSTDGTNPAALNLDGSITITSDMAFRPLFQIKEVTYSLTVNGTQATYSPLSSVTAQVAQADIPEGKQFAYWADAAGKVISYSNPYTFAITGDITLTAVYENSAIAVIKEPTLTLSAAAFETVSTGKHKLIWYAAMDLPEGYTLVESGILRVVSNTPQTTEQMTFDTAGIYRRIIQVSASIPNQYYYSVTASDGIGVSVRAYIIIKDKDGNLETIFSDVQYGCYS